MKKLTTIWLIFLYFLSISLIENEARLPNELRCGDKDCSTPISKAKTLLHYSPSIEGRVSFRKGIEVEVFSKKDDIWGVKVGDKIGFAPKTFLKESKVFISTENLVTVTQNESPKPVQVDSTQNESADVAVEKTTEIPSVIGSLLSFPSMASAESVEGQNIPTPSSPQYDVVDGTTIWLDPPMPPMQSANEQASPSAPDTKEPESTSSEQIQDGVKISEASDSSENNLVVPTSVNAEQVELPSTPMPLENIITSVDGIDQQGTEKQEVTTNLPEELTGTTTESVMNERTTNSPSLSVETTIEPAADETTESQDIQPTQAGMISNLWNTMFNSGDGTEENSQENDGEEEDEDGEDIDEGDEDGEDGSAEEETVATTTPLPGGEGDSTSNVVVENTEQTSASPGDLSDSFSQGEGASSRNENVRIARQIKTEASEVVHENVVEHEIEKNTQGSVISLDLGTLESSEEKLIEPTSSNLDNVSQIVDENQNQATNLVPDESEEQVKLTEAEEQGEAQDVEKNLQPEEEGKQTENQGVQEQKTLEEEQEQKRLEEEQEQKKLLEEQEQKKLQEEQEQKRLQEEQEQKRLQEEQEEKRLQEEQEQKRLQEEQEQKRLQEEQEQKRLQEEQEQKRLQEEQEQKQLQEEQEQKRLQEEQDQKRLQEEEQKRKVEEENLRLLEAEKKMILENEANLREEQRKREREDAERLQEGQKLRESLEKQREQFKLSQGPQQTAPEVNDIVPEQNVDSVNVSEQDIVNSEEDASTSDPVTTSEGMFSWFSGLFGSSAESGSNDSDQESIAPQPSEAAQPPPPPHLSGSHHHKSPVEHQHEHPPVWSSAHQTMCSTSEAGCDMKSESESENDASSLFMGIQTPSLDVILMRLVATAITLLLGAVSFYFLRKKHVDSSLVARINELEKQLLVASKEAVILREEVSTVDASVNSEELSSLREELESCRLVRADLEEQVSTLERELEEATETGIELNKLLSETLEASKGKAHAGLADSVERLQRQLDGQKERVDSLTRSLKSTSAENESLKSLLAENKEKISVLEAELAAAAEIANNTRREKEEANVLAAQELQQVQSRLEDALSTKVLEESRLHSELSALKLKHETLRSTLSMRDAEVKALQDTLKELEANGGKADKLLDVTKMKAELEEAKKDKASFQEKYIEEEKARKDLEERLVKISETLKKLEVNVDIAEKSKEEAETRLSVLSNYFKEKEEQLQKELGLKEAIVAQHRGDESTVVKHLQSLQEEVSTYRAQNESLKKEILDQERDFKAQMATLEKKAHDNWMTARQAERRLEDSRHEAAQLRNRLTLVEKSNADPSTRMDVNGEGGVASPVMMMPLPPLGDMETPPPLPPFMFSPPPYPPPFMPPPLPPHPMGRPPPLGRMSSPPPPLGQFSPPPPPYDRLDRSSRSPSPPPHRYHHRSPPPPQQWDSPQSSFRPVPKPSPKKPSEHRDHKGSAHNSGHSNESDKSREHV